MTVANVTQPKAVLSTVNVFAVYLQVEKRSGVEVEIPVHKTMATDLL